MFEFAYTAEEAAVEVLDLMLPGWEHDEQAHGEDARFVSEADVLDTADEDDFDFDRAYDAWREDTFDPDNPWF